jgi:hypothetical protein
MVINYLSTKQKLSFFKEAREIIRSQPAGVRVDLLRERVDELQEAFDLFTIERTAISLANMVSRWTRVQVAIDAITGVEPTPPSAGKMELPLAA